MTKWETLKNQLKWMSWIGYIRIVCVVSKNVQRIWKCSRKHWMIKFNMNRDICSFGDFKLFDRFWMKIRWNFQGDFQNVAKIPVVFIVLTKTWTLASYTKKNIIQINHHNHPSSVLTLSIALSFVLFCISGSLKLAAILDWLYTVVAKYQNSAFRIARESLKIIENV